jgi:hypothetical protein
MHNSTLIQRTTQSGLAKIPPLATDTFLTTDTSHAKHCIYDGDDTRQVGGRLEANATALDVHRSRTQAINNTVQ